jgi:sec-independent protein translocase protein TatA
MPFALGHWELIVLALVLVLLFGPRRLPAIARTLGRGVREVRDPLRELQTGVTLDDPEPPARDAAPDPPA